MIRRHPVCIIFTNNAKSYYSSNKNDNTTSNNNDGNEEDDIQYQEEEQLQQRVGARGQRVEREARDRDLAWQQRLLPPSAPGANVSMLGEGEGMHGQTALRVEFWAPEFGG